MHAGVNISEIDRSSEEYGWKEILAGIFPFIYFGPLMVLLAYPFPYPAWRFEPPWQALMFVLTVLPLMAGVTIGWLRRFPRWSYPYLCMGLFFFFIVPRSWQRDNGIIDDLMRISFLLALVMLGLLIYLTRRELPLRGLLRDIRADWTRLGFGLLVFSSALYGSIDHDEDPVLTVFVIGPCLVLVAAALLIMREPLRQRRALYLAAGMLAALVMRLFSGQFFYIYYGLFFSALVFAPFLLQRQVQAGRPG